MGEININFISCKTTVDILTLQKLVPYEGIQYIFIQLVPYEGRKKVKSLSRVRLLRPHGL